LAFFKNPNLFSGTLGTLFLLTEQYNRPDGSAQPTLYEFIFSAMTDAHNHSADPLHAKKEAWSGRFSEPVAEFVLRYTQSVSFDKRMAAADIAGSLAHAQMLAACGVISEQDLADIRRGMAQISDEIKTGKFLWQLELEDVHLNIEARLTQLIGDAGKRLHTGRSRNDQVATDIRLYLRTEIDQIIAMLGHLQEVLVHNAAKESDTLMPGFTHMQVAQPVSFGHHLLAYVEMFERDRERSCAAESTAARSAPRLLPAPPTRSTAK
jgi:argininosuccinate lyase